MASQNVRSCSMVVPQKLIKDKRSVSSVRSSCLGVIFLKHHDSTLGLFEGEQRQATVEELRDLLVESHPQEVYVPYFNDMHSDHIETHHLAKAAVQSSNQRIELWQYLVWSLWEFDHLSDIVDSKFANLYSVAIDSVRKQKNQALRAYRSQYIPIVENFTNFAQKRCLGFLIRHTSCSSKFRRMLSLNVICGSKQLP